MPPHRRIQASHALMQFPIQHLRRLVARYWIHSVTLSTLPNTECQCNEHRPGQQGVTLARFPLHRSARRSARSSFLYKQHDFLGVAVRESFMHSCLASAMLQDQQNKVCFETDRRFERLKKRPVLCQTSHPCAGSSRPVP